MIEIERGGTASHIVLIRLQRPEKSNAYTQPMLDQLATTLTALRDDTTVRAVVITGAGDRAFCAGADRHELDARAGIDALDLESRRVFDMVADAPWPTVAAINGVAAGGGFELALACDVRICHPSTRLFLPEVRLGLIPAAGGTRRLTSIVGPARSKEVILFGRELDAATALAWGLVSEIVSDVAKRATELAERAGTYDPVALRLAKGAIDTAVRSSTADVEGLSQALLYERRRARHGGSVGHP
ncbi:MAG: enoyl-CoA hydratase/isomerase family protein [Deltaproteobacteria bacterium]|nr:enoyl-CoA hydratase/isomerase family protein [Deltaproteobacteria bacterium]